MTSTTTHIHTKPTVAPRTGAASRQRIQPIDIPASPKEQRISTSDKPTFSPGTSPIQLELENLLRQRQLSKESPTVETPPSSPKEEQQRKVVITTAPARVLSEDIRNRVKLPGLSALQQRVLSLDSEEEEPPFKSLTEVAPVKPQRTSLAKSHSFKNEKPPQEKKLQEVENETERRKSVTKAASLDSVKNLEDPVLRSELNLILKPTVAKTDVAVDEIEVTPAKAKTTPRNSITITGPSHTAVVNVTASNFETESKKETSTVTKIQLKHESQVITTKTVPEFLNKQLNKVETRPVSNVVFSMKSPKISPEEAAPRPKSLFPFPNGETNKLPRKFSKEDVEIIESSPEVKETTPPRTPPVVPTTPTQNR